MRKIISRLPTLCMIRKFGRFVVAGIYIMIFGIDNRVYLSTTTCVLIQNKQKIWFSCVGVGGGCRCNHI